MHPKCRFIFLHSLTLLAAAGCSGGGDSPGPTGPPAATTGSLRVTVVTTGSEVDTDGYTVVVGSTTRSLGINAEITIADLTAGNHAVTLEGVSVNCSTPTTGARTVAVVGGQTSVLSYQVACSRKPILFVSDRSGANQVYRMNEDGQGQVQITAAGSNRDAVWSPDGTRIAFVSTRDSNDEIYVMNADGSGLKRLTNAAGSDREPSWGAGGRIAFTSDRDGNLEIYTTQDEGVTLVRLTNNSSSDTSPSWAPNGASLAFVSNRDGNDEIYRMDAAGGEQTRLTTNGAADGAPSWSPNGNTIAFHSLRAGHFEIFLMDFTGRNLVKRTLTGEVESQPRWSPSGTQMTFVTSLGPNDEVCVGSTTGGAFNISNHTSRDSRPAWRAAAP